MPTFVRNPDSKLEHDRCLFHEMMTHPAIFTHPNPRVIAVLDQDVGVLNEVLKHRCITAAHWINKNTQPAQGSFIQDARVKHQPLDHSQWLGQQPEMFDVIIQTESPTNIATETFDSYFQALNDDGIFIQSIAISYLELDRVKPIYHHLDQAGFKDWQLLTFPQPSHPYGMRVAVMASKAIVFKQISEKVIFNRGFSTQYYNFDMHKAALALPQYLHADLA